MKQLRVALYWLKSVLVFLTLSIIMAIILIKSQIFKEYDNMQIIFAIIISGVPFYLITSIYKILKHRRYLKLLDIVKQQQWTMPQPTGTVITALVLSVISLICEIIGVMNIFRQYKVIVNATQISVQQPDIIAGMIFMVAGFTLSTIVVGMRRYNIINSISMILYLSIRTFIAIYLFVISLLTLIITLMAL